VVGESAEREAPMSLEPLDPTPIETKYGVFYRDPFARYTMWHYQVKKEAEGQIVGRGSVADLLIEDALQHKPPGETCWFWFNGAPAQMFHTDTVEALLKRWKQSKALRDERGIGKIRCAQRQSYSLIFASVFGDQFPLVAFYFHKYSLLKTRHIKTAVLFPLRGSDSRY
jgi:hypothetical protein